jgi:hypothetical protein
VGPSWAAGCLELRRDPVRLQVSESTLCYLLSGEACDPARLQASESILGSLLSREACNPARSGVAAGK